MFSTQDTARSQGFFLYPYELLGFTLREFLLKIVKSLKPDIQEIDAWQPATFFHGLLLS